MGTDKAFVQLERQTLLERALTLVRDVCDEVTIVGDPAKFGKYGTVVPDVYPGCGPLGGIHAALEYSSADLNLIIAVDMPFVSKELLTFLFAAAAETDALVTVPSIAERSQPTCAVYRRAFAVVAEKALREGKYKIDKLFSGVPLRLIDEAELAAAGFSERMFLNVNTPDDLRAAQEYR